MMLDKDILELERLEYLKNLSWSEHSKKEFEELITLEKKWSNPLRFYQLVRMVLAFSRRPNILHGNLSKN